ncbi:hypothetical protein REPUB_Repub06bG0077600 [Reevesia pubescens]
MGPEARKYVQCLIRDFEWNGLNLTATKIEEVQCLRTLIDELSFQYVYNLNDDSTSLLFHENELAGLPTDFLKTLEKVENGMFRVALKSHHVAAVLELCKIGKTRRLVAMTYGKRCAKVNLSILEDLKQEEGDLPFGVEDLLYYVKKVEQQEFDLDLGALKQYFPVNLASR